MDAFLDALLINKDFCLNIIFIFFKIPTVYVLSILFYILLYIVNTPVACLANTIFIILILMRERKTVNNLLMNCQQQWVAEWHSFKKVEQIMSQVVNIRIFYIAHYSYSNSYSTGIYIEETLVFRIGINKRLNPRFPFSGWNVLVWKEKINIPECVDSYEKARAFSQCQALVKYKRFIF